MTSMCPRSLLIGFDSQYDQEALVAALQGGRNSEVAPYVALISRGNKLGDRAAVYINSTRGFLELNATVSRAWPFPPPCFWKKLLLSKPQAMEMMARRANGIDGPGSSHQSRSRQWREWVTYCYGLLVHHRIDRVIQNNVPHLAFEFIVHCAARALGIKTNFTMQLTVKGTFVVAESIAGMFEPLAQDLQEAGGAPALALHPRMEDEFARRTGKSHPWYMVKSRAPVKQLLRTRLRRILHPHLNPRVAERTRAFFSGLAKWRAQRAIGCGSAPPSPFVYFPLHLQPEATTMPLGGVFADQLIAMETLARAVPPHWTIAVKENPKQRLKHRTPEFYERLREIPRVRLVDGNTSTFDLICESSAVATITGNAGWEALFAGKPVFTFGEAFFKHAPGVIAVDELTEIEEFRQALVKIDLGTFPTATHEQLRRFLASLQRVAREGVANVQYLQDSGLEYKKAILGFSNAIREMMGLDIVASVLDAGGNVDVPDTAVSSSEAGPLG